MSDIGDFKNMVGLMVDAQHRSKAKQPHPLQPLIDDFRVILVNRALEYEAKVAAFAPDWTDEAAAYDSLAREVRSTIALLDEKLHPDTVGPYHLDDDDMARFPNDTDVVVIHKDYYWKLRGYEEVCLKKKGDQS